MPQKCVCRRQLPTHREWHETITRSEEWLTSETIMFAHAKINWLHAHSRVTVWCICDCVHFINIRFSGCYLPAQTVGETFWLCPRERYFTVSYSNSKDMSMELIHIQIYQSRHFSFSLMLLGGNGYLCLYHVNWH